MAFEYKKFAAINLDDVFFDSLKADYDEFTEWFEKKRDNLAYVFTDDNTGLIDGFLYLKQESEELSDIEPALPALNRLKVGTFKINAHGTKLGDRFVKKIFDHAIAADVGEVYVTVFPKHGGLIALLARYGFKKHGTKTTKNGVEDVMVKKVSWNERFDLLKNYPLVKLDQSQYLLGIYPVFHTRLLPDSMLNNENAITVEDVSHTNSINKIYLTAMRGTEGLKPGDALVIYRTSDNQGPAEYRAVATSICVVQELRNIRSFATEKDFLDYCLPFSVFSELELKEFYAHKKYPNVIRFTYNIALGKRITRHELIEGVGIDRGAYAGFMKLSKTQFKEIAKRGKANEGLIVD